MKWLRTAIDRFGGPTAVAARAGMSGSHLKNIYRGERNLTPAVVIKLKRVLTDVPQEQWLKAILTRRSFASKAKPIRASVRRAEARA